MYSFNSELNHSPKLSPATSESSIGSPSSPTTSPARASGGDRTNMTMAELQQENARLRKEVEAKETKLNSSMRSIKMFWSPELKKERAARKAEEEKCARLREQFSVVSEESQVSYSSYMLLFCCGIPAFIDCLPQDIKVSNPVNVRLFMSTEVVNREMNNFKTTIHIFNAFNMNAAFIVLTCTAS